MTNQIIQQLLPPVVMISACGLLCMAQFARFTAITSRLRIFNKERLDLRTRFGAINDDSERVVLTRRSEGLTRQAMRLLKHARMIQFALMALVTCIICMALCSLMLGGTQVWPAFQSIATGLFILGVVCVLVGMVLVFLEIVIALDVVRFETQNVTDFVSVATPVAVSTNIEGMPS